MLQEAPQDVDDRFHDVPLRRRERGERVERGDEAGAERARLLGRRVVSREPGPRS